MLVTLVMTFCTVANVCIEHDRPVDGMQACVLSEAAVADYMHREGLDVRGFVLRRFACTVGGKRTGI